MAKEGAGKSRKKFEVSTVIACTENALVSWRKT
jgi:hypothetical protein